VPFSKEHSDWAEFGSYLGGTLGPILALLAFLGVIRTLAITRQQYRAQSDESRFFNLVNLHMNKVNSLCISERWKGYNSFQRFINSYESIGRQKMASMVWRRCFESPSTAPDYLIDHVGTKLSASLGKKITTGEMRDHLVSSTARDEVLRAALGDTEKLKGDEETQGIGFRLFSESSMKDKVCELIAAYDNFYEDLGQHFGHYFRNMHHILRFIKVCNDREEFRRTYRAQLSRYEIVGLFYNYMSRHAGAAFVENVYTMRLFEGITLSDIFFIPSEKEFQRLVEFRFRIRHKIKEFA
jgi:hypothetical protein